MNKKNQAEIIDGFKKVLGYQTKLTSNQKDIVKALATTAEHVGFLLKTISVLWFFINILIWRVFLWEPFESFLSSTNAWWNSLTENYKILILGIIGTFFAAILAHIIGVLLTDRIKNMLKKKK